mgnify:CR=1 FL=1
MMKKMNNKGFTLVEVLAVLVILSILIAIMVPSVNYLINMNKENNYKDLKNSIVQATKVLFSDYRYEISIEGNCDNDSDGKLNVLKIGEYNLLGGSRLPVTHLISENNISLDANGFIENPLNSNQVLNPDASVIIVQYQCDTKDFIYTIDKNTNNEDYLIWVEKPQES